MPHNEILDQFRKRYAMHAWQNLFAIEARTREFSPYGNCDAFFSLTPTLDSLSEQIGGAQLGDRWQCVPQDQGRNWLHALLTEPLALEEQELSGLTDKEIEAFCDDLIGLFKSPLFFSNSENKLAQGGSAPIFPDDPESVIDFALAIVSKEYAALVCHKGND